VSVGMSLVFNTHFYFSPTPRFQWGYSTLKSVEISSKISSTQGDEPALVRGTEGLRSGQYPNPSRFALGCVLVQVRRIKTFCP
jgi:hypothetical protein